MDNQSDFEPVKALLRKFRHHYIPKNVTPTEKLRLLRLFYTDIQEFFAKSNNYYLDFIEKRRSPKKFLKVKSDKKSFIGSRRKTNQSNKRIKKP